MRLKPIERQGLKVMSIGFLIEEETPMIWRGPMVISALTQMLREVEWGTLDVMVVDMPPGTGDAQLTMAQQVPLKFFDLPPINRAEAVTERTFVFDRSNGGWSVNGKQFDEHVITASPRQAGSRLCCQLNVTESLDGLTLHLPEHQ
mgnify:CR=1 FL=1